MGRLRKRRWLGIAATGILIVVVMMMMGSGPTHQTLLAQAMLEEERIVEEIVVDAVVSRPTLSPLLFGGSFVAETDAPIEDDARGGQEDDGIGVVLASAVLSPSFPLTIESSDNSRNGIETYQVRVGDAPSTIAARFGITTNTLLWANGLFDGSIIRPGDELSIPPIDGVLHAVRRGETVSFLAQHYNATIDDIITFNGLAADGALRIGDEIMIPDGTKPRPRPTVVSRYASQGRSVSGYFLYPASGRISQRLHGFNAVDIAHSGCYAYNVPVYAAAAGQVTIADPYGWNGGYGQFIKMAHPNRTATLYAHLRHVLVGYGQHVAQGQIIGYMGSTGRSTGCHVHFEVHGARNPFAF